MTNNLTKFSIISVFFVFLNCNGMDNTTEPELTYNKNTGVDTFPLQNAANEPHDAEKNFYDISSEIPTKLSQNCESEENLSLEETCSDNLERKEIKLTESRKIIHRRSNSLSNGTEPQSRTNSSVDSKIELAETRTITQNYSSADNINILRNTREEILNAVIKDNYSTSEYEYDEENYTSYSDLSFRGLPPNDDNLSAEQSPLTLGITDNRFSKFHETIIPDKPTLTYPTSLQQNLLNGNRILQTYQANVIYSKVPRDIVQQRRFTRLSTSASSFNLGGQKSLFPNYKKQKSKIVLVLPGGGTRGYMQQYYIHKLKREISGPLPIDAIAGTSVGALNGASLLAGKEDYLYDNFISFAKEIFPRGGIANWLNTWLGFGVLNFDWLNNWSLFNWFDSTTRAISGMFGPRYSDVGRKKVIDRCLDGYVPIYSIDEDKTKFLCPFVSATTKEAVIYTNFDQSFKKWNFSDVLMMTSAAPTYFNPYRCKSKPDNIIHEGIDGGIYANDPGEIAYLKMRTLYPEDKITIITLGTGKSVEVDTLGSSHNRGYCYWGGKFVDLAMTATENNTHSRLMEIAEYDDNFDYFCIQPLLSADQVQTDSSDEYFLYDLRNAARAAISKESGGHSYREFCEIVKVLREHGRS